MPHRLPQGYRVPARDEALLAECDVTYFMASGPGGQHRNRTRSAVRLHHRPSGIVVIARRRRSQHLNRADAVDRLRARLEDLARPRTKRIPTRPSGAAKRRRLEEKRRKSETKKLRGRVRRDE